MTLSFKQQLNGKPTHFVEKIYLGIGQVEVDKYIQHYYSSKYSEKTKGMHLPQKKHTIRTDAANRWRAGMGIHFVINNRTPNRLQFLPVLPCISVQKFEVIYMMYGSYTIVKVFIGNKFYGKAMLKDCKVTDISNGMEVISINDGFDSVNDFLEYFSDDFTGKIIHWTDLKY